MRLSKHLPVKEIKSCSGSGSMAFSVHLLVGLTATITFRVMPDPLANDRQWGNSALKSYNSSSITLCVDKDYLSSFWKTNFTNMWSQDESGWIRMNRGKSGWSRMNQDEADNFLLFWHIVAIGSSSSVLYWSKSRREDIRQAFSCHDDWLISFSRDLEWSKSWEFSQRDSSKSP